MKKSNRVFIALIGTLYIVPALTFGVAQFTSEKCLTGFTQKFQIIQIDNPELKAENIKVDVRRHKNCLRISSGTNIGSKRPVAALLRGKETVFAGSQPPRFSIIG